VAQALGTRLRPAHGKPQSVTWACLKTQFGADFGQMKKFKYKFRIAMLQVLAYYPKAKVEADSKDLILRNSLPPISTRMIVV